MMYIGYRMIFLMAYTRLIGVLYCNNSGTVKQSMSMYTTHMEPNSLCSNYPSGVLYSSSWVFAFLMGATRRILTDHCVTIVVVVVLAVVVVVVVLVVVSILFMSFAKCRYGVLAPSLMLLSRVS